jgi:hypothetical protein
MTTALRVSSVFLLVFAATSVFSAEERVVRNHAERRGISLLSHEDVFKLTTQPPAPRPVKLDARKSIFITDLDILKHFSFAEVMDTLAHDGGAPIVSKEALFQQWWNTANQSGGALPATGPTCEFSGLPATQNGFKYTCLRDEGLQVATDPFHPAISSFAYTPIALSNRFDLAELPSKGGTDCGEYRIVFERNSGVLLDTNGKPTATPSLNRNLIIFEAVLPIPKSQVNGTNLNACRPVQEFWEKLSEMNGNTERAKYLHDFYFKANTIPGFEAVVRISHYGSAVPGHHTGQIRTNQFMAQNLGIPSTPIFAPPPPAPQHGAWLLREFHMLAAQTKGNHLQIVPVPVSTNPPAVLFTESDTAPPGPEFRTDFPAQVASLSTPKLSQFNMSTIPAIYDSAESEETLVPGSSTPGPMEYDAAFKNSTQFSSAITSKLAPGSPLTAQNIVDRAQSQTCAGCHHLSVGVDMGGGLGKWPQTLPVPTAATGIQGFTQEQLAGPQNGRYQISASLTTLFLPFRACLISDFLSGQPSGSCP